MNTPSMSDQLTPRAFGRARIQATLGFSLVVALSNPCTAQSNFEGPEALAGGFYPVRVSVADVDQDGDLDILTPSEATHTIFLLRNLGGGVFAQRQSYPAGDRSRSLAVADFTGDGKVDVVAMSQYFSTLMILTNTGAGGFGPPGSIPCFLIPLDVKAADLNADGAPDFVVIYESYPGNPTLTLHMNQGLGVFGAPIPLSLGGAADNIELGDLDGDGAIDIVLAGGWTSGIQFVRNQGLGTFDPPVGVVPYSSYFCMADLDGDSDLDFATSGGSQIRFYANQGNATFAPSVTATSPRNIAGLQSGDIDGDGDPDLMAVGSDYPSELLEFTNQGAGVFAYSTRQPTTYQPYSLEIADMDGDGDNDIVVPSPAGGTVTVHMNHGDGSYSQAETLPLGASSRQAAVAELDGNSNPDLIVAAGGLRVLLGLGDGTFATPVFYDIPGIQMWVAAGDLDGDGDQDVATANGAQNDVAVLFNPGNGALSAPVFFPVGVNPVFVTIADVDGDGDGDLVSANSGSSNISILFNTGTGTFGAPSNVPVGTSPIAVSCADLDGDGDLDIACANFMTDNVSILRNLGGGSFSTAATLTAGARPTGITCGDLDGDGDIDLAVCNRGYSDPYVYTVSVYRNSGSATFTTSTYGVGALPQAIGCAELDGQPGLELFTANYFGNTVSTLHNLGNGTFASHHEFVADTVTQGVTPLDVDGDGDLDLLACHAYGSGMLVLRNATWSGTPYCAGDGSTIACPCGNNSAVGTHAGCTNSSGAAGVLRGSGSALVSDDELVLSAQGMTGSVALFFQGTLDTTPSVIDDGIGCVGGSILRLGTKPVSAGSSSYPLPGDPLVHVRGAIPAAGATRFYQCFYRNAVTAFCPPATSNRTNALRLVWRP